MGKGAVKMWSEMNVISNMLLVCGFSILIAGCQDNSVNLSANDYTFLEKTNATGEVQIAVNIDGELKSDIQLPVEVIPLSANNNDIRLVDKTLMLNKGMKGGYIKAIINDDSFAEKKEELYLKVDVSEYDNLLFNSEKNSGLIKVSIVDNDAVTEPRVPSKNQLFDYLKLSDNSYQPQPVKSGRVLRVGPGHEFPLPSMAARKAKDGDLIEIDANGDYLNDHAIWKRNNLTITGVNGRPHLRNNSFIKNGKAIWVVKGKNTRITNVEFSGAKVYSKNGAAIRLEGRDFYMSDCYVHDNENGILTNNSKDGEVVIENCEFSRNGFGRGKTHNIYIGRVKKFTFKNSISKDAYIGHPVKTRARINYILYNRIFEGKSSYAVDISNGGQALILGNQIFQGPETENWSMVAYGAEGLVYKRNELMFAYNSLQNERSSGVFLQIKKGANVHVVNNVLSGKGKLVQGDARQSNNVVDDALFNEFNGKQLLISNAAINKVIDAGRDINIYPEYHYVDGRQLSRPVIGNRSDVGATEY